MFTVQTGYPSACNSTEILLLHEKLQPNVWLAVATTLLSSNVQLRCDPPSLAILAASPSISAHPSFSTLVKAADDSIDYDTEFLDLILAVKTITDLTSATSFINAHSSHHTDAIITESRTNGETYCRAVDSAGTYVNASTRFADGFRYGFGTEVGISTGRTHARGPVGLEGLVIYKYVLKSDGPEGHAASDFGLGEGKKAFKHTPLPF